MQNEEEVIVMLMHWAGDGWGPWFLVFPLLWIAVLVAVGFAFRRGRWGPHRWSSTEDVLAERYARGEISADEYRQRLGVLRRKEG
jgi:putative membrane protein